MGQFFLDTQYYGENYIIMYISGERRENMFSFQIKLADWVTCFVFDNQSQAVHCLNSAAVSTNQYVHPPVSSHLALRPLTQKYSFTYKAL